MLVVLDVRDIRRDAIRVTQSIFLRNSPTETVASRISRTTIGHGNGDAYRRLIVQTTLVIALIAILSRD